MKTLVGRLAIVFGVIAVALAVILTAYSYRQGQEWRKVNDQLAPFNALADRLRTQGLPADLQSQLAALPKSKYVTGYALVDAGPDQILGGSRAVVGDRPDMAGKTLTELAAQPSGVAHYFRDDVRLPDGHSYMLAAFGQSPFTYGPPANPLFGVGAVTSAVLSWLALALWIFLDSRRRSPADAYAWGLLGLLSGPVGLGVYRILRPAPEVCPGCGTVQEPGGSFCPNCGHALRPACPECRQPVQADWHYCRACGVPLQEQ